MQNTNNGKYKLQFVVDEEDFNQFEAIRHKHFSSTSKQFLLKEMFDSWMNEQCVRPHTTPIKKEKENANEQHMSTRRVSRGMPSWSSKKRTA